MAFSTFDLSLLAVGPAFFLLILTFIFRARPSGAGLFQGFGFDLCISSLAMVMSVSLNAFSQNQSDLEVLHFFVFLYEVLIMAAVQKLATGTHQRATIILGFVGLGPAFGWALYVVSVTSSSS